ncbi:replication-relaxation family protein [Leifsonia sp. RAF41]|uniref:replication-relaxation family protein n=1 Tax=Leifsonia sp. RAF41 TaxID=3233056 RepID=UPI003F9CBEC4
MSYVDPRLILCRLSSRDLAVLDDIEAFRLLTTRLVQRLHFPIGTGTATGHATAGGATKAAVRVLTRLAGHGVVGHLERRIGGVRQGSQGYIWQLTSTGATLQRARRGESGRRRYVEPSALFTEHTLAVAEMGASLRELALSDQLELLALETEPSCWREYIGSHGTAQIVKPDLYAVTATGAYEDHLFLEVDRGTEHLPQILNKCRDYAAYHQTGIEQREHGVFPAVTWIVQDEPRARQIHRAITAEATLPDGLFQVITVDTFPAHLISEADSS